MADKREKWTIRKAVDYYGFKRWGNNHFSVGKDGTVHVHPLGDETSISIPDVIEEALGKGLKPPLVIRFQDLLRQRVSEINRAFPKAIKEEEYPREYRGVCPIRVNQLHQCVEEPLDSEQPSISKSEQRGGISRRISRSFPDQSQSAARGRRGNPRCRKTLQLRNRSRQQTRTADRARPPQQPQKSHHLQRLQR